MSEHTPGPWCIAYGDSGRPRAIYAPKDKNIPGAIGNVIRWNGIGLPSSPIAHANALLIAAAPDMLEALKDAQGCLRELGEDGWSDAPYLLNVIGAAIAKATGVAK